MCSPRNPNQLFTIDLKLVAKKRMKKGACTLQAAEARKMPPPFHGPQQNSLETIYYHHGFPLVSNFYASAQLFVL